MMTWKTLSRKTILDHSRFLTVIEGISLAPVGGHIEAGEDPLAAAKRELLEETGYQANSWKSLGSYRVDANHGCGMAYLFLAQGAEKIVKPYPDDLEEQALLLLDRGEMQATLLAGEFKVLSWGMAVAMALIIT